MGLVALTSLAVVVPQLLFAWSLPWPTLLAALPPLLLLPRQLKVLRGDRSPPAVMRQMSAAFGAMVLTGLIMVLSLWLTA